MNTRNDNLQELQILEQTLQNLLLQKQMFQMELSETESALKEINCSKGDVFKLIGQLMLKSDKQKIIKELEDKKRLLGLRLKSIEKQESSMTTRVGELREDIINLQKGKKA